MADLLSAAEIADIQDSVAPAADDELSATVEVWRKPQVADGVVAGGAGVDQYGAPVNTSTDAVHSDERFAKIAEYPARITRAGVGNERNFGDQTVALSPWTVSINWALNPDVEAADKLLVRRDSWAPGTSYVAGDIVQPTESNGRYYVCVLAGTSGTREPRWWLDPKGTIVNDNGIQWEYRDKLRTFEVKDPGGETTYPILRMVRCEELKQ